MMLLMVDILLQILLLVESYINLLDATLVIEVGRSPCRHDTTDTSHVVLRNIILIDQDSSLGLIGSHFLAVVSLKFILVTASICSKVSKLIGQSCPRGKANTPNHCSILALHFH